MLLLQHGDEGALGVVLTRPTGSPVGDVLPAWDALASPPGTVFTGGPVQPEAALCLGRRPPGAGPSPWFAPLVDPQLGTVDLDAAPPGDLTHLRVYAGYAGWGPGQLEAEVEEGAWWVLDALPGDGFAAEPDRLWDQVLRRQGPPLAFAAGFPEDPTLN